jgi:prepilin signal peptidase PulO-like enzyme (type II secretory pathway)
MKFKEILKYPGYVFKFGIYLVFILMALMIYFKDIEGFNDKSLKTIYSAALLLYGLYRIIRTYQDLKAEIKENNNSDIG